MMRPVAAVTDGWVPSCGPQDDLQSAGATRAGGARRGLLSHGIHIQWRGSYGFSGRERVLRDQRLHHDLHYARARRSFPAAAPGADRAALLAVHVERGGGGLAVARQRTHLGGCRNGKCRQEPAVRSLPRRARRNPADSPGRMDAQSGNALLRAVRARALDQPALGSASGLHRARGIQDRAWAARLLGAAVRILRARLYGLPDPRHRVLLCLGRHQGHGRASAVDRRRARDPGRAPLRPVERRSALRRRDATANRLSGLSTRCRRCWCSRC